MPKRMAGLLAGWALLTAALPLRAQEALPPTRVAVVRLDEVLKNYVKAQEAKKALDTAIAPYKQLMEKLQKETSQLQQAASDPKAEPEEKDAATKKLVALRRQMEDLSAEARKVAGQKGEQMLIDVYADLEAAIEKYADAHQIDLVLTFTEAAKQDRLKYPNVSRKVNAAGQGGFVPLFIRPRLDITQAIIDSLNETYVSKD